MVRALFRVNSRSLRTMAFPGAAALLALSCGGTLPPPNTSDVKAANTRWPGTSLEQLQAGRRAYLAQCGKCHSLKSESAVPKEAWEQTVNRMRAKNGAKLSDEEVANIARYLYVMASR